MNTKKVLMFAALSIGIFTALTGTGLSQVAPAFADRDECEDNDDNNCNERTHKINRIMIVRQRMNMKNRLHE